VRHAAAVVIAPLGDRARTRKMNDAVLALARAPGSPRFFAIGSVHPGDGRAALLEIDRIAREGARGLKLHPNTQAFDVATPAVRRVVARAARRGLPILFDAYSPFDADQAGKFVRLAMEVPTARLVLAHAHGPRFPELLVYPVLARYARWRRNVWVDLSATASLLAASPFAPSLRWVLGQVGEDRLLFGSDYPLDDPRTAVRAVAGLGFGPGDRARIFFGNAVELYGLEAATPAGSRAGAGRRSGGGRSGGTRGG
jgi:predicted TIM-barrel fold metal-dependent hydrolase